MARSTDPDPEPEPSALDAIQARRTARQFDPDRPLPPFMLDRLLTLATLAPSPRNLQPWRFVVVRDPRNRQRLRGCAFGDFRITQAPVVLILLAYLHPDRTDLGAVLDQMLDLGGITAGPALERFRATATREWERGGGTETRAVRASMLAAGNLMLAAEALGLASCWLDGADEETVRQAFGIPDDHAFCGLIALGYGFQSPGFPGRLGLDHVCFTEHFGGPWTSDLEPTDQPLRT